MRLLYLAGVVILAFMARDATGTRVLDSDDSNQHRVHVASTNIVSIARLLQERSVINEERAGGVFASATDKLFKSSTVTDAQFQKWLSMGETAESVFYRMKLKKNPMKLFQSPQFPRWVQYADELSASGKGAAAISVLSNKYGDDTLYRMIQLAKKQSSTDVLATRLQTEQLEHWLKIGKDPAEVFKLYDLNYAGMQILSNSQFGAWTKYVDDLNANKGVKVSIIPTLTKYYSGEDLFHIALAAKRVDETKAMGTKLEDAVFKFWIHRMISPDNVLVELGLEKSTKTLLENPLLNILIKYTEAFNVNYVRRKTTVIETLTRAFDDVTVARMLRAGRAESTTEEIAKKFQGDQLEMWLNSGKSVDDVYKLLNLPPRRYLRDLGDEKLFNTWLMFINTISIKNPEKISDIFTTLTPTFLERPMMQILEAATKFPRMEKAASKLQLEMAQAVFSTGVPPPKAFELLSLDTVGDSVLSSHLFKKWMLYVEDFNKKNPADKQSWFLPLSVKYQGSRLDRIIDNAMKDPSTTNLAKMVEKEKMTEWLEKRKFSPSIAFRDLHLHKAGENVFLAPKFELWVKYLSDWNQAYPSMKTTMINGFQDNYHTFDLVSMLTAAERDPTTQKLASQLMDALADKWVAEKKTLDYVKWWLSHVSSSDDMLKRFSKKLNGE